MIGGAGYEILNLLTLTNKFMKNFFRGLLVLFLQVVPIALSIWCIYDDNKVVKALGVVFLIITGALFVWITSCIGEELN